MNITYNGILLQICSFNSFVQRQVSTDDNANRLYTHFHIDCNCVLNANATASWQNQAGKSPPELPFPGLDQGQPVREFGDRAPVSLRNLRDALLEKRKPLSITVGVPPIAVGGGQLANNRYWTILQSPSVINGTQASVDANNGPNPIEFSVLKFYGSKSMLCRFVIETWINECTKPPSPLLDNRWDMTEELDEAAYSTLHYRGRAVFRSDLLANGKYQADDFRGIVLPPVQIGYQRKGVQVTQASNGLALDWTCHDEQQDYCLLPASGIVRVEGSTGYETVWTSGLFGAPLLGLPQANLTWEASVWGTHWCSRDQLADALIKIIAGSGADITTRVGRATRFFVHYPKRFATASITSVAQGIVGGIGGMFGARSISGASGLFSDFSVPDVFSSLPVQCIGPAGNCRSDTLVQLFTQKLKTACDAAAKPPTLEEDQPQGNQ